MADITLSSDNKKVTITDTKTDPTIIELTKDDLENVENLLKKFKDGETIHSLLWRGYNNPETNFAFLSQVASAKRGIRPRRWKQRNVAQQYLDKPVIKIKTTIQDGDKPNHTLRFDSEAYDQVAEATAKQDKPRLRDRLDPQVKSDLKFGGFFVGLAAATFATIWGVLSTVDTAEERIAKVKDNIDTDKCDTRDIPGNPEVLEITYTNDAGNKETGLFSVEDGEVIFTVIGEYDDVEVNYNLTPKDGSTLEVQQECATATGYGTAAPAFTSEPPMIGKTEEGAAWISAPDANIVSGIETNSTDSAIRSA